MIDTSAAAVAGTVDDLDTAKEETSSSRPGSSKGGGSSSDTTDDDAMFVSTPHHSRPRAGLRHAATTSSRREGVDTIIAQTQINRAAATAAATAKTRANAKADPAFVGAPTGSSLAADAVAASRAALSALPSPYSPGGARAYGVTGGHEAGGGGSAVPPVWLRPSVSRERERERESSALGFGFGTTRSMFDDWKREFAAWRHRHGVPEGAKVFIMTGSYDDVRSSLVARGWHENLDPDSRYFDLKWALKARDIDHRRLREGQIVNHFVGAASALTTKSGLCRSLRSLHWYAGTPVDSFFPRCYDLAAESDETRSFHVDFKWGLAASTLRRVLLDGGLSPRGVCSAEALALALDVCQHQLRYEECLVRDSANEAPELPPLVRHPRRPYVPLDLKP